MIRDKREAFGLTEAALAERVGISTPHLSKVERSASHGVNGGPVRLSRQLLERLDGALHLGPKAYRWAGYNDVVQTKLPPLPELDAQMLLMLQIGADLRPLYSEPLIVEELAPRIVGDQELDYGFLWIARHKGRSKPSALPDRSGAVAVEHYYSPVFGLRTEVYDTEDGRIMDAWLFDTAARQTVKTHLGQFKKRHGIEKFRRMPAEQLFSWRPEFARPVNSAKVRRL